MTRSSEYYQDHKEQIREYNRKHYEINKEYHKKYYQEHRDKRVIRDREYSKLYHINHKDEKALKARYRRLKTKQFLFELLGGKRCIKCGFSDERALQFDHINGGGCKDYDRFGGRKRVDSMQKYYIKHPEEAKKTLQVLCANCNWIKRHENNEISTNNNPFKTEC